MNEVINKINDEPELKETINEERKQKKIKKEKKPFTIFGFTITKLQY